VLYLTFYRHPYNFRTSYYLFLRSLTAVKSAALITPPIDLHHLYVNCAVKKKSYLLTKNPYRPYELYSKCGKECLPNAGESFNYTLWRKRQRTALAPEALPGTLMPLTSLPPNLTPGGGRYYRIKLVLRAPLGPEMPSSLLPPILTLGVNGQHRIKSVTRALPSPGMLSSPLPPIPTLGVDGQYRTGLVLRALSGLKVPSPIPSILTPGGDG